jgi:Na+/H+ antiporter NhaD/arsenite permease-like protein
VFFIAMFITMEGVWRSGILQPLLTLVLPGRLGKVESVLTVTLLSILLSQVLSNVPLVKLSMEFLKSCGYGLSDTNVWLALAATSTIAGNLTILGAASNIIVLETLESRMGTSITYTEFLKVGGCGNPSQYPGIPTLPTGKSLFNRTYCGTVLSRFGLVRGIGV